MFDCQFIFLSPAQPSINNPERLIHIDLFLGIAQFEEPVFKVDQAMAQNKFGAVLVLACQLDATMLDFTFSDSFGVRSGN